MPRKAFVGPLRAAFYAAPVIFGFAFVSSCAVTPIDTPDDATGGSAGSGGMGATAGAPSGGTAGSGYGGGPNGGVSGLGGSTPTGGSAPTGGVGAGAGVASGGVSGTGGFAGTPIGGSSGAAGLGATGGGGTGGTAGSSGGGAGVGGTAGATGGTAGSSGTGGGKAVEDEGTDCVVPALPAAGSLPTVARLPDPFTKVAGGRIATKAEWRCRRAEIKKQAETYAYGTKPPKPQMVMGTVSNTNITVTVGDMGRTANFSASVTLPSGTGPFPAVVVLGGLGADSATIRGEGVATINYDPYSLGREGTGRTNKQGAFYTIYGSNSTTGLLVAWAWGVSRIIDVLEQSGGNILRADAVGVTGCSRFGKGAFTVGVFDQRIALTMPIESGTAGVPIWRGVPGEGAQSLSSAYGEQPWFGDAFTSFTGTPTRAPIDTHSLVAMVAPRGLLIMDNPHIANLGPRSAHVAALGGAEVYTALGAGTAISYHSNVASGTHCAVRSEWTTPLRNALQRFLKKSGTAAGVISARSNATGNLAEWRDWATPVLN
jgi:hypothetical protein